MNIDETINKYNISLLLTFGSYKTEKFTKNSDIDVAYLSEPELDVAEELKLLTDLILYFKNDRIDLVNLSKAVPLLAYEIACKSYLVYEKNNSFIKFKMKASGRFADTKFLRDLRKRYLKKQIELIQENI